MKKKLTHEEIERIIDEQEREMDAMIKWSYKLDNHGANKVSIKLG